MPHLGKIHIRHRLGELLHHHPPVPDSSVALIFALIGAIVAEFVGSLAGLGVLIQSMNFNMDVAGEFSVLLVLSIVGLVSNRCILLLRRRILFWDSSQTGSLRVMP